jgi:hypothetical protein
MFQIAGRMWHRRAIPPRPDSDKTRFRQGPAFATDAIPRNTFRRKSYSPSAAAFTGL